MRGWRHALGLAGWAGVLGALTGVALAEPRLAGQLAAGHAAELRLDLARGDYVAGWIDGAGQGYDLDLRTATGEHLRRLADDAAGRVEFRFVAEADGPAMLRLQATEALASYAIEIEQVVPRAAQLPPAEPPPDSPAIRALMAELAAGGDTERFWQRVAASGTPLVEKLDERRSLVTFLWRGAERNVRIFGAPSDDHEEMRRLGGSDVWFRTFEVPNETRLSYQLAPDVPDLPGSPRERRRAILATAQADPLNRHPEQADAIDRFARHSTLTLPAAPSDHWARDQAAPAGTLVRHDLASQRLGNTRRVWIYRPAGFEPTSEANRLLLVFDGATYVGRIPTPTILDNLIAQGRIPPVLAVFVGNPDMASRGVELPGNPDFADMLADELFPWIEATTGSAVPPARTALAGSSYGGLAAAYVALRRPDRFGNVLSQSGSFWWSPGQGARDAYEEHMAQRFAAEPRQELRFYLSAGLFEGDGILATNRHLRDVLGAKGYPVTYAEHAAGHDQFSWRATLAEGLLALFGDGPR